MNNFLSDVIDLNVINKIRIDNLDIFHTNKKIRDDMLWELDHGRQVQEMQDRLSRQSSLCIGYIK